jgi:hypothetical protein
METGFAVTAMYAIMSLPLFALSTNIINSLAMILNLSIGEEVEQDARQLEGQVVQQQDEISPVGSQADDLENEKMKNGATVAETSV